MMCIFALPKENGVALKKDLQVWRRVVKRSKKGGKKIKIRNDFVVWEKVYTFALPNGENG